MINVEKSFVARIKLYDSVDAVVWSSHEYVYVTIPPPVNDGLRNKKNRRLGEYIVISQDNP